ncbi:hypothetical protein PENTCL1PPCAC_8730, partial [Pristionchus entomophagus]
MIYLRRDTFHVHEVRSNGHTSDAVEGHLEFTHTQPETLQEDAHVELFVLVHVDFPPSDRGRRLVEAVVIVLISHISPALPCVARNGTVQYALVDAEMRPI